MARAGEQGGTRVRPPKAGVCLIRPPAHLQMGGAGPRGARPWLATFCAPAATRGQYSARTQKGSPAQVD